MESWTRRQTVITTSGEHGEGWRYTEDTEAGVAELESCGRSRAGVCGRRCVRELRQANASKAATRWLSATVLGLLIEPRAAKRAATARLPSGRPCLCASVPSVVTARRTATQLRVQ